MTSSECIRAIFLQPKVEYTFSEAAMLLGWSFDRIAREVSDGDLACTIGEGGIPRLPWEEVALAATEQWSQATIEGALGEAALSVLPDLVRLADLHVRVPKFGLVALAHIAQRERTTIDNIVARRLLDLVVAESGNVASDFSGLEAAIRWPLA